MIFLDTSAIYALADVSDPNHVRARERFSALLAHGFLVHDYVLLESTALLQRRLGLATALKFNQDAHLFETAWVDADLYREALSLLASLDSRQVSMVDCMSFVVMRQRHLQRALAFDVHFERQGFTLV